MENDNPDEHHEDEKAVKSTTAENLVAIKEIMVSSEAKEFTNDFFARLSVLFGATRTDKLINVGSSLLLMIVAFGFVGAFAYYKLIPDGTAGVLSGIIVGYFFKK